MTARYTTFILPTLGLFLAAACGTNESAPQLPPEDSMELPSFFEECANCFTEASGTQNVQLAATSVVAVTAAVQLAMLVPRAAFVGVLAEKPTRDGTDWVWSKSMPLLGFDAELRGRTDDAGLTLEMRLTGTRDTTAQFDDFLWFSGTHSSTSGHWSFFDINVPGERLRINWQRQSSTDKSVTFTNVSTGEDLSGDSISYALSNTSATMVVHDEKDQDDSVAEFTVEWDTATGAGRMSHTTQGFSCCWDTVDAGQENIVCP